MNTNFPKVYKEEKTESGRRNPECNILAKCLLDAKDTAEGQHLKNKNLLRPEVSSCPS